MKSLCARFAVLWIVCQVGAIGLAAAEFCRESPATIQQALASGQAILIDVREKDEWDSGRIQGSRHLPLSQIQRTHPHQIARVIPADKVIYCHCAAGYRSAEAADFLGRLGYRVKPLRQGVDELVRQGFPRASR